MQRVRTLWSAILFNSPQVKENHGLRSHQVFRLILKKGSKQKRKQEFSHLVAGVLAVTS